MQQHNRSTQSTRLQHSNDRTSQNNNSSSKGMLKMYNPSFGNFDYENAQKHKRTALEHVDNGSTISNVSDLSINLGNDLFQAIPVLREIVLIGECLDDNFITYQEFIRILAKLHILQSCDGSTTPFKYFEFTHEKTKIRMDDFVGFLTSDMSKFSFIKHSKQEILLKLGLEVYRAIGKENLTIEIKHLIQYMKEHKKVDIDMTNMLELFDMFSNPDLGILKGRTNLMSFFHKNAPKISKALTLTFMAQLQMIVNNKFGMVITNSEQIQSGSIHENQYQGNKRLQGANNVQNFVKIYDPNRRPSSNLQYPLLAEKRFAETPETNSRFPEQGLSYDRNSPPRVIDLEHNRISQGGYGHQQHQLHHEEAVNLDISDVFNEVQPKNRGWLMRKSNKKVNKWSMVFFEITEDKLISYKPTSLKKSIDVANLEIHKCNFLEVISKFEKGQTKKTHKRSNSQSKGKKEGKALKEKGDLTFFIIDKSTKKTYLIRSIDNLIIGSIIHFYLLKSNPKKAGLHAAENLNHSEPEYSGVIEIATAKNNSVSKFHSNLKQYSFKKKFLIIKHGRFNIYEMKQKDTLNLIEYEVKPVFQYDLIPQTNPYVFSLIHMHDYDPYTYMTKGKHTLGSVIEENPTIPNQDRKKPLSFIGYNNDQALNTYSGGGGGRMNTNPHYEDLVVVEEKKNTGFFGNLFKKFTFKKKKIQSVVLACDTEIKRRQWLLTINFYIQLLMKNLHRSKMSYTKESVLNTDGDLNLRSSIGNELFYGGGLEETKKKKKNKSSMTIKHKNTSNNPDFVNVYDSAQKDNHQGEGMRDSQLRDQGGPLSPENFRMDQKKSNNIPLITEPDASKNLDSEEVLMTFTQYNQENMPLFLMDNDNLNQKIVETYEKQGILFNNEIKSVSEAEIWQKFIIFFIQEGHQISEFEIGMENPMENTTNFSRADMCDVADEDAMVRTVLLSDWCIRKNE